MAGDRQRNVLEFTWCVLRSECPADAAERFLAVTGDRMPEASPVRFGTTETAKGGIEDERSGDDAFVEIFGVSG